MNKLIRRFGATFGMAVLCSGSVLADVTVSEPTGGQNISADKALNSTNGAAFTALGSIMITEGTNTDFAIGNNQTFILTAPGEWRFNAGVGSVSFTSGRDLSAASIAVTASNLTVTLSVGGSGKSDVLTISGVQVQALDGVIDLFADSHIRRVFDNPGTALIAGIENDFTPFGQLSELAGAARVLAMQTQPAPTATAGTLFAPQPELKLFDQFGNFCALDGTTVVTASRASGTGTLQGTLFRAAAFGVVTYTNLSLNSTGTITIQFTGTNLTSVTSDPIVVGSAVADRLVFTTQPGAAVAGAPFGVQPVLKTRDPFGSDSTVGLPASQLVTVGLTSGTGTLLGTTTFDIGTNAGNGVVTFTDLQINAAGANKKLTAASAGLLNGVSSNFTVTAGAFTKLQLLVPGESAVPATATGKTGSPTPRAASVPFNVTVNAVDTYWNLVNTATHAVGITSSDVLATLPANAALVAGAKIFSVTLNTFGSPTITATDATDGSKSPDTSPPIPVNFGPASKLALQTQPSSNATAGSAFAQQPMIRVEDSAGNLVTSDNGRMITAARATGTGTLQGTLTATTVNGIATFNNLAYNVAETITLNLTAAGLTNATSSNIVVSPTTADRLVFSTQPGSASRVGSVLAAQPVIKSQDPFGNNSVVGLPTNLNLTLALTSGSGSLFGTTNLDIGTAVGNGTVTFTNLQCSGAGTNKQLTASASGMTSVVSATFNIGGVTPATGGGAISADTVAGVYTTLAGPIYFEAASADAGAGTIILNPPTGFIFDIGTPAPQVIVTRLTGSGANTDNINDLASGTAAAVTSRATNQITFTVSAASANGVACSLTWTNVRVRPLSGTVLTNGNITKSGTATMAVVTAGSTSLGSLTEVAGAANRLAFTTQPGSATAGAPFGVQPVVRTRDQFGNNSTNGLAASKMVSLVLTAGTGPLLGTTNLDIGTATGNGVVSFTDLQLNITGANDQLTATSPGSTNAVSSVFTNSAGAATRLTIQTQPSASATAGTAFAQQPAIRIEDAFGNLRSADNTTVVTASRATGGGTLLGTTSRTAVNGVVTFTNLSYNVAETITISFASSGLTGATSSNVVVSAAAANRLTIQTQPSATATAGVAFVQQPLVRIEDQFGNLRSSDNSTVVTAVRAAGSGALQGATNRTASAGVVSFNNLSHNVATNITLLFTSGSLTNATSTAIAVSPAAASQLVFTTQPGNATAGSVFATQPVVKTRDPFGNDSTVGLAANQDVTMSLTSGTGPLQGDTIVDIGTAAGSGSASFTDLRIDAAGSNKQLTAQSSGLTSALSSVFTVNPGALTKLQLLVPGETTAPGTAAGKTGSPTSQSATVPFNVTVNAVDANWNLINTITHTVGITSSDALATLPVNAALVAGTRSFSVTLNSLGNSTMTASDITDATKNSNTSPLIAVSSGPAAKLAIQTQPSSTATAGAVLGQQPVIRVEDSAGNLVTSDNGRVITAARGTGTGTLQGTLTATTVNGVATFANLSYIVAETITLNLTAAGLTNATSSNIVVSPTTADRLVFSPQPGGVSRVGSVLAAQPVIKSQDQFGNNSAVGLPANLNLTLALTSGSGSLSGTTSFDIGTAAGNGTVTFTNLQCSGAGTNKQLTASASGMTNAVSATFNIGGVTPATGGGAISADTVAGVYTTLAGPIYFEAASADAGAGTIILNPPTGFIFDIGTPAPQIIVTRLTGSGANTDNINDLASGTAAAVTSRGTNQITFTVSAASANGVACSLTWTNVRVRPLSGTVLTNGNITKSGTATMAVVIAGSTSFGALTEVAGAANRLAYTTQPGSATAGAPFGVQPVVRTRDQFGNNSTNGLAASKMVSLALTAGTGPLLGTTNLDIGTAAGNGVVSFTDLQINIAGANDQLTATSPGSTNAVSSVFTVNAAAASRLTIQTQPSASATAGAAFAQQPVIRIEDEFGNLRNTDNTTVVTVSRATGGGTLLGTTSRTAVNGVVTFTNLSYNVAETITLSFASSGLAGATSSSVVVSAAAANRLTLQTQPSATASAGAAFAQQPVIRIEDTFGNLRSSDSATVVTATRAAGSGTLQGTANATAVNGIVSFANLAHNIATNITITFNSGSLTSTTSTTVAVSPAAASKLTIQTQPSAAATAGIAFAQQPVVRIEDAFGNLTTSDNSTVVTVSRSAGGGTLQGNTSRTASAGIVTFTNLSHNVATNITIQFSSGALTNSTSSTITVSAGAADHLVLQTQPSASATAGVAFAQQPVIRIEDAFGNLRSGDSATVVTASRATGTGALQGATSRAAASGVVTFTNLSYNVAETLTIGFAGASLTGTTSGDVIVSAGAANRLTIQTPPSATATAGAAFAQQPVIRIEDQFGNVRSADNSTVVTATRIAGSGMLQGSTNVVAIAGVVAFTNLSHNVATNITIQFTSGGLTNATSGTIAVGAAAASKLAIQTQPSASATAGVAFAQQPVLGIEDAFGNFVSGDNTTVVSATRNAGSGVLQGTTSRTAANGLVTFTNLAHNVAGTITIDFAAGGLSGATSANVVVNPTAPNHLAIQVQPSPTATAGAAFAPQPLVRIEDVFGNLCSNTNLTVVATRNAGSGALQGTTSIVSASGVATFTNLSHNVATTITINFAAGALPVVASDNVVVSPAAASRVAIQTQPSATATAGVAFAQQPAVRIEDAFGNLNSGDNSTVVTASRAAGSGVLQGIVTATASAGVATFTDLSHNAATNITIQFGSGSLIGATSTTVAVSAAAADHLTIQTQPSTSATAGAALAPQPVIRIEDAFGNLRTSDSATVVTASRNAGSGALQGTTSRTAAGGVVTFTNLSYNVAETITIDFAGGSLTPVTSGNVTVSAAAANRLTIQTQPSATAIAGTAFAQQPVIRIEDQFGNLRTNDNVTVVTATRAAGGGTLHGSTNVVAVNGVVTFANLAHNFATNITITFSSGSLTSATSSTIAVSLAGAAKLTVQTQPSAVATAGVAFAQQPAVRVEDPFGNLISGDNSTVVTASRSAGGGTLQGMLTATAVNGVARFTNLSHTVATNITIQFASGSLTNTTSGTVSVSPAGAAKLTIQTQPASSATAGAAFAQQPVIRIEDTFGNLRTNDNTTVVTASRGSGTGTLQGTTSRAAVGGLVTFTNLSYTVAETITINFASGVLTGATSGNVTVGAAAANRVTIQTQPSSTATASAAFAQQPVIRVEDQFGNLRSADSATVVTATRAAGSGTLQGTVSVTAANGLAAFTDLSHLVAANITIQFSSGSLSNATSGTIAVSPGAFAKLQLLVPGEAAAPGTVAGKTGTPAVQFGSSFFDATVNAVDANWNRVTTATDLVGLTSSDASATLPAGAALISGTRSFSLALNTSGSATVTASDLSNPGKPASTSPAITVITPNYAAATGGDAISADTTGGTYTNLTGPAYSEVTNANVGVGTIILKVPAGFVFDTGGTAPNVLITRLTGSGGGGNNINSVSSGTAVAMTSVTTTQLVFTVSSTSLNGVTCNLTWQNVRVRPMAGTPLASGNLSVGGTASVASVSTNSNFGTLREVIGVARKLALQTAPSATATAGVAFTQQPVVQVQDQFGNVRTNDSTTVVSASRSAGSGTLQGMTNRTAVGGVVTFTNLSHTVATNITVLFAGTGLTNVTSSTIAVSPAAAAQLAFITQPGNGTFGGALSPQPVLRSRDSFGNNSTTGLGANKNVTLSLSPGAGSLTGVTTLDIGTNAGNGVVSFSGLGVDSAGINKQMTASASGLSDAVSGVFSVAQASQTITFGALANKTYGNAAFVLTATASSGLPVSFSVVSGPASIAGNTLTITGAGTVAVRGSQPGDANWTAATSVTQSFTVAKAPLTITADSKTRTYGVSNPPLTVSYSGFVNGETASALSGSVSLSTTATPTSAVAGSPYSITVAQGTLASSNYSFSFVNGLLTVSKATLTVTAGNKTRAYGTTNPPLTFTYAGFVNGENASALNGSPVLSTTATVSSPTAGNPYSISITPGTLEASNYACVFVNGALTVTKVALTVTADDQTRVFGAPDPALTVTYSGFVNGEDASVLSGSPQLVTTANAGSSVAGSPYAITPSQGTLASGNYNLSFVSAELTITPASLVSVVTSSANPSPTGSDVVFTATLTAVAPSVGIPTGAVRFTADGTQLGALVVASNGVARVTTGALTHGVHAITAEYPSEGNFYGVTNSLDAGQAIDSAPVALPATYFRSKNYWVKIPVSDLLGNYTSDADGDVRTLVWVGLGTNEATIFVFGDGIYYLPSETAPNRNTPDNVDYVISDGFPGCFATNQIILRLNQPVPDTNNYPMLMSGVTMVTGGVQVRFTGEPEFTYLLQRAAALQGGSTNWEDLSEVTMDEFGQGEFTDVQPPSDGAFYRLAWLFSP